MRKITAKLIALILLISLISCEGSDDGNSDEIENTIENGSLTFGNFIQIPDINALSGTGLAVNLKTTNQGLYLEVHKYNDDTFWIYRLQQGGPSPVWIKYKQPDLYYSWEPSSYQNEIQNTFAIFFFNSKKNGYDNINTGLPALLEETNPNIQYNNRLMLVDNSPSANKWLFDGKIVKVKQNNSSGNWNTLNIPSGYQWFDYVVADRSDAAVWVSAGNVLYRITVTGQISTFDVSNYYDSNYAFSNISKVRLSYDPLHKDVYFSYQNKVFRIQNDNSLSLFYTIQDSNILNSGHFCIDNTYIYTSDGIKTHLLLSTKTNIIPDEPKTSNMQIMLDYYEKVNIFKTGQMETSKDPLNPNLYILYNDKILTVSKGN